MIVNKTKIRVSYADTDQMGVMYYGRYFEYFERGRTELLRELGTPYAQMEENGIKLPVVEAYCKYKKGIKYDELILIKTSIEEFSGTHIRMNYKIFDETEKNFFATGYTIHSFVSSEGKAVRPPKDFVQLVQRHIELSKK